MLLPIPSPHSRWSRLLQRWGAPVSGCRGGLMIEAVLAVSVLAVAGTALMGGLSTTYLSFGQTEVQSVAENIGRNQMESVFSSPYQQPPATYPPVAVPPAYSVTATAEEYAAGDLRIEKVVVTVQHLGQLALTLETLRTMD